MHIIRLASTRRATIHFVFESDHPHRNGITKDISISFDQTFENPYFKAIKILTEGQAYPFWHWKGKANKYNYKEGWVCRSPSISYDTLL